MVVGLKVILISITCIQRFWGMWFVILHIILGFMIEKFGMLLFVIRRMV
jgi:hypothetical protein